MTAVVFLGGTLCDERLFAPQIDALRGRDGRDGRVEIFTPLMDWPGGEGAGGSALGALADSLLRDLPPRFALVGLSLGGIVGLEMLRRQPLRVCRAALLDTNADADTEERRRGRERDFARAQETGLEEFVRDTLLPRQLHEKNVARADLRRVMCDMARDCGMARWRRQLGLVAHRGDSYGVLAGFSAPLLVGCGEADRVCLPAAHAKMAAAARQGGGVVTLLSFKDSGHVSTLENADEVTAALAGFLVG